MTTGTLNPRLAEIVEDFTSLPGKERLQLLLEFSDDLAALPERYAGHRDLLEQVPECQSPLFLAVEVDDGDAVHLFFDAPPEAPTTTISGSSRSCPRSSTISRPMVPCPAMISASS